MSETDKTPHWHKEIDVLCIGAVQSAEIEQPTEAEITMAAIAMLALGQHHKAVGMAGPSRKAEAKAALIAAAKVRADLARRPA